MRSIRLGCAALLAGFALVALSSRHDAAAQAPNKPKPGSLDDAIRASAYGGAAPPPAQTPPANPASGKAPGALRLDGAGAWMTATAPEPDPFTKEATISAWVRADVAPSQARRIFQIVGKSGWGTDLDLQIEQDNRVHFYVAAGRTLVSRTVINPGTWYRIDATYRAQDSIVLYVNRVAEATLAIPGVTRLANTGPITVGENATFHGRFFQGLIKEVSLRSRALSAADITSARFPRGPELALVAAYPLDGNAKDVSGAGRDGRLQGAAKFEAAEAAIAQARVVPQVPGPSCPGGMQGIAAGVFSHPAWRACASCQPTRDDGHGSTNSGSCTWQGGGTLTSNVSPICIDKTEVTVDAYTACVASGACSAVHVSDDVVVTSSRPDPQCNYGVPGRGRHPMNCVDWNQAVAYCQAQGKRLPSDEEWMWAARGGSEGRAYPWGAAAPSTQLCWSGLSRRDGTCPVASIPDGNVFGVSDLYGNVSEWTSATFDPNGWFRVVYGGGWPTSEAFQMPGPSPAAPTVHKADLGFRCVSTPPGAPVSSPATPPPCPSLPAVASQPSTPNTGAASYAPYSPDPDVGATPSAPYAQNRDVGSAPAASPPSAGTGVDPSIIKAGAQLVEDAVKVGREAERGRREDHEKRGR
jgi:sulfatase-modifying factor enzyme 1/concanavalin A-like lectin/glucanase superfamily protein